MRRNPSLVAVIHARCAAYERTEAHFTLSPPIDELFEIRGRP
jgi:hypothetical protein